MTFVLLAQVLIWHTYLMEGWNSTDIEQNIESKQEATQVWQAACKRM